MVAHEEAAEPAAYMAVSLAGVEVRLEVVRGVAGARAVVVVAVLVEAVMEGAAAVETAGEEKGGGGGGGGAEALVARVVAVWLEVMAWLVG